jgi:hypothetical protein
MKGCREISERTFWFECCELPPLKRMGYSGGPGASLGREPCNTRICSVTGQPDKTYGAHFVVRGDNDKPRYYRASKNVTLAEFKAMCEIIIPGTGPCSWGYGKDL